jgi:hypothetical protein
MSEEDSDATELLRLFLDALKDDPAAQEVVAKEVFGDLWKQLRFLLVPAHSADIEARARAAERSTISMGGGR